MKTNISPRRRSRAGVALIASLAVFLSGCQGLQGHREGPFYHSPATAYTIDLGKNVFRGEVTIDERCDETGGSTTLWDGSGRMFRVDYLAADVHPMVKAPRFASDMTLLNLVMNSYLRSVVSPSVLITSVDAVHREFLDYQGNRTLFAVVNLNVDTENVDRAPDVSGSYYYGFLLFKKGQLVYVLQHRQPAFMVEKMKSVLLHMAEAVTIPGKEREDTEIEQTRRMLARLGKDETYEDPVRLCDRL